MSIRKLQALKAKKGFTLVELIVVIAIIAILAAILIPLLVNHIRSTRCTTEGGDMSTAGGIIQAAVSNAVARGIPIGTIAPDPVATRVVNTAAATTVTEPVFGFMFREDVQALLDLGVNEFQVTMSASANIVEVVALNASFGTTANTTGHGWHSTNGVSNCNWTRCPYVSATT